MVVALLGTTEFIACEQHRRSLQQQQRGQQITQLPGAQRVDYLVVGGPLGTAVPRAVVAAAISIFFALAALCLSL